MQPSEFWPAEYRQNSELKVRATALLHCAQVLGALTFSLSLGACSGESWKEESLQPDGSTIIVTRSVERGGRHEIGQEPPIKTQSISFNLPGSNEKIIWQDNFSEDLGAASFLPKMLGVSKGVAYLLASPMGCLAHNKWGRPNPPYVIFKHADKQWVRVDLSELPTEFKVPNLVPSNPDVEAKKTGESPVSAKTIASMVSEYQQPEFKAILREKLPETKMLADCEVREQYKGRWILPNDPIARQFIDSQEKK